MNKNEAGGVYFQLNIFIDYEKKDFFSGFNCYPSFFNIY